MFSILVYRNTTDFVSWSWVLQPSWTCFFVLIVLGRFFRNSVYKTMWSAKRARFISFLPIWRPFKSFPHPTVLAWTSTMWNRNGKNRYLWLNHKALVLGFLLLFLLFPHNRGSQILDEQLFPRYWITRSRVMEKQGIHCVHQFLCSKYSYYHQFPTIMGFLIGSRNFCGLPEPVQVSSSTHYASHHSWCYERHKAPRSPWAQWPCNLGKTRTDSLWPIAFFFQKKSASALVFITIWSPLSKYNEFPKGLILKGW